VPQLRHEHNNLFFSRPQPAAIVSIAAIGRGLAGLAAMAVGPSEPFGGFSVQAFLHHQVRTQANAPFQSVGLAFHAAVQQIHGSIGAGRQSSDGNRTLRAGRLYGAIGD
jgi:hypothetical protein